MTVRDDAETKKLERFSAQLQGLEDALPIDPKYRNPKLGALAPIRVVNVVFSAGDGNRGVQTAAFNLPNDERVVNKMGSKRVMLKNSQEAKFQKVLVPISGVALPPAERANVAFDAFFTHILMHELMHGLGPQTITVAGRATTVRQELKESYGTLEEAKADISGLWALQRLVDQGVLDKGLERTMYTTFLASAFRSIRFGLNEAHGRGVALQLNSLLDAGAFTVRPDGTFTVDRAKVRAGRRGADARDPDHPGRGRRGEGEGADRDPRGHPPAGAEDPRPPGGGAGRHRAALHDRGRGRALIPTAARRCRASRPSRARPGDRASVPGHR